MSSHPKPPEKNNYIFHPNNSASLLEQEEIQVRPHTNIHRCRSAKLRHNKFSGPFVSFTC